MVAEVLKNSRREAGLVRRDSPCPSMMALLFKIVFPPRIELLSLRPVNRSLSGALVVSILQNEKQGTADGRR
jgi:hypothetical protein